MACLTAGLVGTSWEQWQLGRQQLKQVRISSRQTSRALKSAAENNRILKEQNEIAASTLMMEERSRMVLTKGLYDAIEPITGKPVTSDYTHRVALEFTNVGKLPVLMFRIAACALFALPNATPQPCDSAMYPNEALGVIMPQKNSYVTIGPYEIDADTDADIVEDFYHPERPRYVKGIVQYFDPLYVVYAEPFCARVRRNPNGQIFFGRCEPGEAGMPVPNQGPRFPGRAPPECEPPASAD
jgi:hypothetical protein